MEKDPEIKGEGNSYTTEFRQYDPRLGRWLSLDPLMSMFPDMSPYVAFDNNPVFFIDPYGLASSTGDGGGDTKIPEKNPTNGKAWENGDGWFDEETQEMKQVIGFTEKGEAIMGPLASSTCEPADINGHKAESSGWSRFWGGVQAVGGIIEAGVGAALIASGVGAPLGAMLLVHGCDVAVSGIIQGATGKNQNTLTHGLIKNTAKVLGANEASADAIATGVDVGISIFGGAVGSIRVASATPKLLRSAGTSAAKKSAARTTSNKPLKTVTSEEIDVIVGLESGDNIVYHSVENGVTKYVGITNNFARREAAHLSQKGINIEPLLQGLTRSDARAVEQVLIEIHGLGKNGGSLINKINSIAKTNPTYGTQLQRGYELLKSIGYNY